MERSKISRAMTEIHALAYEADQLRRDGTAHALGMFAVAMELKDICQSDAAQDELLSEPVDLSRQTLREYIENAKERRYHQAVEQGERTRPYSLRPHEELGRLVDGVTAEAYFKLARVSGVRQDYLRQTPGSCSPMFYITQHELRKQGVETQHMWWFGAGNNHHFLRTTMPNDDLLYIDPTWQQYLPESTDYCQYPHVLIAPVDRITETLAIHGVPEASYRSWQSAIVDPRPQPTQWDWAPDLKELFENDL